MRGGIRPAGGADGSVRHGARAFFLAACFALSIPLPGAIEIVTESRTMGGGTSTVTYWQAFGGYRSDAKGPLEKTVVLSNPASIVTFVRAGRPGSPALWETTLPGRCLQKLTSEMSPHVRLLLDDMQGPSAALLVISLNGATGALEWQRTYRLSPEHLKVLRSSGEAFFLGVGPYIEELDAATGVTRGRFFVADPAQSLSLEREDLLVRTTAGADLRLSLHGNSPAIPPSPDPRMTEVLLANAVHAALPGRIMESGADLQESRMPAMKSAKEDPSRLPVFEVESRLDPGNPFLHFFLGLACAGRNLNTEAQAAFERAESVPDLPFFEYAMLGNLFELNYLPEHADRCYARTLKAFHAQVPLSPIAYCPEELHRAFFPADLEAGRMHISQGNIVRYLKLRDCRRRMFLHSEGDVLDTLRALDLRNDPRLRSAVEGESAYWDALRQDPFLKENHLFGLDIGTILRKVLQWSSILFMLYAFLGYLLIPLIFPFLLLIRLAPPNAFLLNYLKGYPAILVLAVNLLFFPLALFEFLLRFLTGFLPSFRRNLRQALLYLWVISFALFFFLLKGSAFHGEPVRTESQKQFLTLYFFGGIAVILALALVRVVIRTDLLSEMKAFIVDAKLKMEWLTAGVCLGCLWLLASMVVSYFPVSSIMARPPAGITFLCAHPLVARQVEDRLARVHGAAQRHTLLFLKALGLHWRGERAAAGAIYRDLPADPWVLNNRAALLFQDGERGEALKAWRILALQGLEEARMNLDQAKRSTGAVAGQTWKPLLSLPPSQALFSAFVRRSPWRMWEADASAMMEKEGLP